MDWELIKDIATIASPIIGAVAIIVALWIARRSSSDAKKQIDVFMASQTPDMLKALRQYEQQLAELNEQIDEAEEEYETVNPFYGLGGANIDDIEYENEKREQKLAIDGLKIQRMEIELQIKLIKSFLKKK